jgi:polyphosphate kinase
MGRNLDTRVEIMTEIKNPTVHEQVLDQIMMANLLDDSQSWELQEDGTYRRIKATGKLMSAQDFFMKYPSYSGRGTAEHNPRLAEAKKSKRYNPHTDRKPRQKAQAHAAPPPETKDKSGT